MIGRTLSHYQITAALGAGGMGEVYRATDSKLGREVAIKVLSPDVAKDAERLQRFQREAQLLAALNHPHIAAIHGLDEADGQPFLVLELVEGEDLKERLARGAIPLDEALEVARQIGEALEKAHETGIVHRDLKPANVKLTPEGQVKVLDFGLARAWAGDAASPGTSSARMSQSPTLAHSGTLAGAILGTAGYMSPEQARGKPVDRRTDVWAFGVLLWEMLTGRTLFEGETVTDVIAAVVKEEPDLDALPGATPAAIRRLIARCLRKDRRIRLPDIGAARLELHDVLTGAADTREPSADTTLAAGAERPPRTRERRVWMAVTLVLAVTAAGLAFGRADLAPAPRPVVRFLEEAPEGWSFTDFNWPVPSPDGSAAVIRLEEEDPDGEAPTALLWLRSFASARARPLTGTEAAEFPFWSPDSRSIGFFAEGELRRLSLGDGAVQRICALPSGGSSAQAAWNGAGTIVFGVSLADGSGQLYRVEAGGGEPRPLMQPDVGRGESFLVVRPFLPDGRRFGFLGIGDLEDAGAYLGSLDDPGNRSLLIPNTLQFDLTGEHVVFNRGETLFARRYDSRNPTSGGEPIAIASSLAFRAANDVGYFAVSPGALGYLSREAQDDRVQLTWVDRKGEPIGTLGPPGHYRQIALSPDERRLAVEIRDADGQEDIWLMDTARGVATSWTSDPARDVFPLWSPDGRELAFARVSGGNSDAFRKGLARDASEVALFVSPALERPRDWSRDGKTLLYVRAEASRSRATEVWALDLASGDTTEVVRTESRTNAPRLSPDRRWLAYMSDESGAWEVYVEPFGQPGGA